MVAYKVRGIPKLHKRIKDIRPPRRLWYILLVIALLAVFYTQRQMIADAFIAMSKGALIPLAIAAICELVRIVFHAGAYTKSFNTVGYDVPFKTTFPAWFKSVFMNTILPSGGTSGLAPVIDAGRQRGVPVGSATTAALFTQTCYYSAMVFVVCAGFWIMAQRGTLTSRDVLIGCILGLVTVIFILLLLMGHFKPGFMQQTLRRMERKIKEVCNKLHLPVSSDSWADSVSHSFSSAATQLGRHPSKALRVLLYMAVAMVFDAAAFVASGYAFGITGLDALFGGYVTTLAFSIFTITPGGVGVVEGLTSTVLISYGYEGTLCVSAILTYRALVYWIPFAIGGIAMRVTKAFGSVQAPMQTPSVDPGDVVSAQRTWAELAVEAAKQTARVSLREESAYSRKRKRVSIRDLFLRFLRRMKARTVVCVIMVAVTACYGLFSTVLPPDPVVSSVVVEYIHLESPVSLVWLVMFCYFLLIAVPGILMHDQGNWILGILGLVAVGILTGLTARGITGIVLVVFTLMLMVVWHGCFTEHGFLNSALRFALLLVYAALIPFVYILLAALRVQHLVVPEAEYLNAVGMGLQAMVFSTDYGSYDVSAVSWYFESLQALMLSFIICLVVVVCLLAIQRAINYNRAELRAARAKAHEEAQKAAEERKQKRKDARARKISKIKVRVQEAYKGPLDIDSEPDDTAALQEDETPAAHDQEA